MKNKIGSGYERLTPEAASFFDRGWGFCFSSEKGFGHGSGYGKSIMFTKNAIGVFSFVDRNPHDYCYNRLTKYVTKKGC